VVAVLAISVHVLNGDTELCHLITTPVCPERVSKPLVLPEQIVVPPDTLPPIEAGSTVTTLKSDFPSQDPPRAVSVKVTVGPDVADAVYVAKSGVPPALFVNEPPAPPSDQVALVASNPYEPPKAADVPP
jgi:hypothetical protein